MTDWSAVREQFPMASSFCYLDAANKGLVSKIAASAMEDWVNDVWTNAGRVSFSGEPVELARQELAALIGASAQSLALVKNTSEGVNVVAQGLRLRDGDNVLVSRHEHQANGFPWRHLEKDGVEVRLVDHPKGYPTVDDYVAYADSNTKAITASWVFYGDGTRLDVYGLAEFCRSRGIFFLVDAIQAVGLLDAPIDGIGANAVVAGGHKGLLGLTGTGFLWVAPGSVDRIVPPFAARFSFHQNDWQSREITFADGARRFEYGNPNQVGMAVLRRSASFLRSIGLGPIEKRISHLTDHLLTGFERLGHACRTPRAWEDRGAIVTAAIPQAAERLSARLSEAGIVVTVRENELRASVGIYTSEDEIDRLMHALSEAKL